MPEAKLRPRTRPTGYKPPGSYTEVTEILEQLKKQRQPVIDRIWRNKRALRGQWEDVMQVIPRSYRRMLVPPDLPQVRDMVFRVAGLVKKHPPAFEVMPPSGRPADVNKAAKEEARLHALRMEIADQQNRDAYAMGIDAQISWGESWISVMPDGRRMSYSDEQTSEDYQGYVTGFKRGEDESAEEYKERYSALMADGGLPLIVEDHDPQTVFPSWTDGERLGLCLLESEHVPLDINLGFGYKPIRNENGKTIDWKRTTLSEPYVPNDSRMGAEGRAIDHQRDTGTPTGGAAPVDSPVKKVVWMDPWTYQCWLDGILVEEWQHNFGIVPMFFAAGGESSDRDPAWATHSIVDPALTIARQVVLFSAILASNAMQHGFPTPFLKNPEHGLVHPASGEPLTRRVALGEMNLLGPAEEIEFPYLQANMVPDFFRYLDFLNGTLEQSTLSNFGKALGTDIAGYAIAQIRSMQMSVLSPVYTNAARQWRNIAYFERHIIRNVFPGGLFLRGAIETTEVEGKEVQYRPVLEYSKKHCTDFSINVHIEEGIMQDEIAERKSALEMMEAGVWSPRRVMEATGVEDSYAEQQEIDLHRTLRSPAADEIKLQMATQIATERMEASRTQKSSPFYQALEQSKQSYLSGGGQFRNQGATPENAGPDGTPLNQQGERRTPQRRRDAQVPRLPGGVEGVHQTPVGAPG